MFLLLTLGTFQRHELRLGQHQTFLGGLRFQRLQTLGHGFKIVAQPDATLTLRRNRQGIPLGNFVGDPDLAVGWQFQGQFDHGSLDLRIHAVLEQRPVMRNLLQGGLAAAIVQFLEPVEACRAGNPSRDRPD